MKTQHIHTNSTAEAWKKASEIFPTDYSLDSWRSARAGYDVYHSTAAGISAWISDLGNRLEVNLPDGSTVNVWIEEEDQEAQEADQEEIRKAIEAQKALKQIRIEALYNPTVCQEVTVCVQGYSWASAEERKVFEALRRGDPGIELEVITEYAVQHGIRWGRISSARASFIDGGRMYKGHKEGHYIVTGLISAAIGEELDFLSKCTDILNRQHEAHREE